MSDEKFRKGLVFQTERSGRNVLCIHKETAIRWIEQLQTNGEGWARFEIRKKKEPKGLITHTLYEIPATNLTSSIELRETKIDLPAETKEAEKL